MALQLRVSICCYTSITLTGSSQVPLGFRQKMILKEFDVAQLDESEANNMFDGFFTRHWGRYFEVTGGGIGPLSELALTVSCSMRGYCDVRWSDAAFSPRTSIIPDGMK